MKKYNSVLFLALLILFLFDNLQSGYTQGSAHSSKLYGEQATLFSEISEELMCQCGCNLVLGQCGHVNCPSAIPMREKIEEMILAKNTKADVLNYFMNEYTFRGKGPFKKAILSQPDTSGFDLMAWVMPFLLFVVFTAVLFVVVKRATSHKKTTPENLSAPAPTSDIDRRIEEELKKLE